MAGTPARGGTVTAIPGAERTLGAAVDAFLAQPRPVTTARTYYRTLERLAGELGIALAEASDYIKRYFERLPGVRAWLDETVRNARETGYVTTMYGRRRYLPELNSQPGGARAQAERIAINTPIQGTAADLIKLAMIRLDRVLKERGLGARMILQVHDELLLEAPENEWEEAAKLAKREMEGVAELKIPLKVELKSGPNWAEMSAAG